MRRLPWLPAVALALVFVACGGDDDEDGATISAPETIEVTSAEFEDGGAIPKVYSCDGQNHSPPLAWTGVPEGTLSQAILMDDPDAGGYVHWVLYDLEPDLGELQDIGQTETLPGGGTQGKSSTGDFGYAGPCPPRGETHTYVFRVYALDTTLGYEPGASRDQVEAGMEGHVLAFGELTGTFGR